MVENVDDAERRGMKDADGAEGVNDVGGVAGVNNVARDAGRDNSAVTGTDKDRFFFFSHADIPEPQKYCQRLCVRKDKRYSGMMGRRKRPIANVCLRYFTDDIILCHI